MLKIRIKIPPEQTPPCNVSLKWFVRGFLNNLASELHHLLKDYHSIQEHTNRNKIIEYINAKLKDVDAFFMIVKAFYSYKDLLRLTLKGRDYARAGDRMIEVADFIANMFENMKTSFIPAYDYLLALKAHISPAKLLPSFIFTADDNKAILNQEEKPGIKFDEIERLMKIYLIKEDLKNYTIESGVLKITSRSLCFELVLCGDFKIPTWKIISVRTHLDDTNLESHLLKRVPPIIAEINNFIEMYENRRSAKDVFSHLESDIQGFYQSFSGKIKDHLVCGYIKNNTFFVTVNGQIAPNTGFDSLSEILENTENITSRENASIPFKELYKKELGSNYAFIYENLFIAFLLDQPEACIGEISPLFGFRCYKLRVSFENEGLTCYYSPGGIASAQEGINFMRDLRKQTNYLELVSLFFKKSREMLPIVYRMIKNSVSLKFDQSINSNFLNISKSQDGNLLIKSGNYSIDCKRADKKNTSSIDLKSNNFSIDSKNSSEDSKNSLIDSKNLSEDGKNLSADCKSVDQKTTSSIDLKSGNSLVDSKREDKKAIFSKIDLICIQNRTEAIESKPGEKIIIGVFDIKVLISNNFKTSLKYLTEDCRRFNSVDALEYVKRFGMFYKYSLLPDAYSLDFISFSFYNISKETYTIFWKQGKLVASGTNTIKVMKTANTSDSGYYSILYNVYLINRFFYIKRVVEALKLGQYENNVIKIDQRGSLQLSKEGIKFSGPNDGQITRILNIEKNYLESLFTI